MFEHPGVFFGVVFDLLINRLYFLEREGKVLVLGIAVRTLDFFGLNFHIDLH